MPGVALLVAIPVAGLLSALLMRNSTSWKRALVTSSVVSLSLSAAVSLWFGWDVRVGDTDPVVGLVVYVAAPAIGLAAAFGSAYRMGRSFGEGGSEGAPRGFCGVVAWAALLAVLCTVVAVAAFLAGLQIT